MNFFPDWMTIEINDEDRANLASTQQAFAASMQGLTEDQQLARATAVAGGLRETDPFTRSLAQQVVDAAKLSDKIKAAQREVKELERNLNTGGVIVRNRGEAHERLANLKRDIGLDHARLIGVHQDTLDTAQRKAAVHFREQRAQEAKNAALADAVARMEQKLEAAAIERQAEEIAKARLMKRGIRFNRAGDSQ